MTYRLGEFGKKLLDIENEHNRLKMTMNCYNNIIDNEGVANLNDTKKCYSVNADGKVLDNTNSNNLYEYTDINDPDKNITNEQAKTILNKINDEFGEASKTEYTIGDMINSLYRANYYSDTTKFRTFMKDLNDFKGALHDTHESSKLYSNILPEKHENLKKLRNELDNKMREIYNNENQDDELRLNQSIYVTLTWTVLATSVLYFLFVKL